ncbi:MAG: hypothetical protein US86_C0006G0033 [Candidatus Daviesbacteria bacterium GW2011_GWA2_38_24]|uniref:AAA+ ATPase domain-containing protein n=1 Tax=Candidatus Daviesbacteria bacterium GW2011_GWA2_38_24 TaxID=1618422 RepID=A0A0G0JFA9_9BACT|nr:MAG: hypothetical protein US86_C0006G0033 [Candidatus Daviesbacteria bacterium GW2011_GWA2_38_24]
MIIQNSLDYSELLYVILIYPARLTEARIRGLFWVIPNKYIDTYFFKHIIASMIIKRSIKPEIIEALSDKKIIIIYGARQVGKTTLIKEILRDIPNSAYFSCDEPDVREAFTDKTSSGMKSFIRGATTVALDEAQRINNIGVSLKLLHDTFPELTIIATGSSSFDLANKTAEPLTGRNISFNLFPISFSEYADAVGEREAIRLTEERLRYGMYPAVITSSNPEQEIKLLTRDYLFKDVLRVENIRKPIVVEKLAKLLAFQAGQEVSYNEIAQKLEISRQTVMSYVRLLEQSFIIFRLPPLGKNLRNEVTRFEKIYFYDTGIRNAIIGDFSLLDGRFDKGALFENFFISERLKFYQRLPYDIKQYFWRTKDGSEMDLVEESRQGLLAYECKWKGQTILTRAWKNSFPNAEATLVNKDNIEQYIL